jgi:hypothetical protein
MAKASGGDRRATIDRALKGLFKALESRPTPDRLRSVVDQLDEGESAPPPAKKAAR